MSKHTPGPWRIGTPWPNGCYTIGTKSGLTTAIVAHSIREPDQAETAEANASLIAAAPELLDSAHLALSIAESWIHDQLDGTSHLESAMQSLDPVRAAIAKANGETK